MKYRKKPVVIEAVQFLGIDGFSGAKFDCDDGDHTCSWLWGNWQNEKIKYSNDGTRRLVIKTLEGDMYADAKDFIIKGVNNEIYPCKPDIFEKTYEKA